jgi:hypothetical protein
LTKIRIASRDIGTQKFTHPYMQFLNYILDKKYSKSQCTRVCFVHGEALYFFSTNKSLETHRKIPLPKQSIKTPKNSFPTRIVLLFTA